MGRPTKYNHELFESICTDIATSSKGLKAICEKHKVSAVSFYAWIREDDTLLNKYTRAREDQADLLADEIISIADDGSNDTRIIKGRDGKEIEVENTEWTNRSKLRVEARKWIAAKLKPKKYGEKVDVTTAGDKISNVTVTVVRSDAPLANDEKGVSLD